MSTSERVVVAEVAGASALVVAIVALFSPGDPWMTDLGFHPAWAVVTIFAARYGARGLFLSLALVWGGMIALGLVLDGSFQGLASRSRSVSDLFALAAAILVGWIAMLHESRLGRMAARLTIAEERRAAADETVEAMRDVIGFLRARNDRIDMSISLWRDLASRLERGEPAEAAGAAVELCVIRSGASAGVVHRWDGNHLQPVAWRGQWSATDPGNRDIQGDRTAMAAVQRQRPVLASEVDGVSETDSDLAVPVIGEGGALVGVIALAGASPGRLRGADVGDAVVVARWLAPSLAAVEQQPRRRTGSEGAW
jgi:hypothetical protein